MLHPHTPHAVPHRVVRARGRELQPLLDEFHLKHEAIRGERGGHARERGGDGMGRAVACTEQIARSFICREVEGVREPGGDGDGADAAPEGGRTLGGGDGARGAEETRRRDGGGRAVRLHPRLQGVDGEHDHVLAHARDAAREHVLADGEAGVVLGGEGEHAIVCHSSPLASPAAALARPSSPDQHPSPATRQHTLVPPTRGQQTS